MKKSVVRGVSGFLLASSTSLLTVAASAQTVPDDMTVAPVVTVPPTVIAPPTLPAPPVVVAPEWSMENAQALLKVINNIGADGLFPADYEPAALQAAMAEGEGVELNELATRLFGRIVTDLRDGRTPFSARVQWFVRDTDVKANPTDVLLTKALTTNSVEAALTGLAPIHPDYAALKSALAKTPAANTARRNLIMTNMERWRWLPQDLGFKYVFANVPEMQLRFVVNKKLIRSYKAVVGNPKTATPQLAEEIQGVVFNPTWTVPQSIIKNEMGGIIASAPGGGTNGKYTWTRSSGGGVTMVQKAGPNNALGLMKLDMPNEHAIFIHDTPARERFNQPNRALSHGCVRAERASELGITLAILQGGIAPEKGAEIIKSGKTTKVPFKEKMPVYISYFTMATGVDGVLQPFADVYGRDTPVFASLAKPRVDRPADDFQKAPVVAIEAPGI
jgi:murein L,D-transpeptidase YcbB/YkuD